MPHLPLLLKGTMFYELLTPPPPQPTHSSLWSLPVFPSVTGAMTVGFVGGFSLSHKDKFLPRLPLSYMAEFRVSTGGPVSLSSRDLISSPSTSFSRHLKNVFPCGSVSCLRPTVFLSSSDFLASFPSYCPPHQAFCSRGLPNSFGFQLV